MKICIIDDEWICHLIIQKLIERIEANSQIFHFSNGQEAFEFIKQQCPISGSLPDLIFLDINMPVANGWMFLDMLQGLGITDYHPSIFISSSSEDINDITRAQKYSDVKDYLPKPLTLSKLKEVFGNMGKYCLCPHGRIENSHN